MASQRLLAVLTIAALALLALGAYGAVRGGPPAQAGGGCPACPPACPPTYVAQPPGDYWTVELQGEYTCPNSQGPTGYCNQRSAAAGEAYCSADPGCVGYLVPSSMGWAGNQLVDGSVILAQSPPTEEAFNAAAAAGWADSGGGLPKNNTFYAKVTPAAQ
jgi:hypothetical protein